MTSEQERQVELRAAKQAGRLQLLLWGLEDWSMNVDPQGVQITQITLQLGPRRGGDVMVIVKGSYEGQKTVAFHTGESPEAALRGALERVRIRALRYREDKPYEPPER